MAGPTAQPVAFRRIGIDFDNTIVRYDEVFVAAAVERRLLPERFKGTKRAVRDAIRRLPNGELAWQSLQGHVYSRGIDGATMFDGLEAFLMRCRREGETVLIISHKTEYARFDARHVNLRQAALDWMRRHRFFSQDGYAVSLDNVFFEASRSNKIKRIADTECTHYIDDLEEVLEDPDFPPKVERILFAAALEREGVPFRAAFDWHEVTQMVFDART